MTTAITVKASKKAERKAPEKQNNNETTIFEATGATSYVFYRNGIEVSTSSSYEP